MLPFQENSGIAPLRVWMNRKNIVFDEDGRNFCKTEVYMKKVKLAS